MGAASQEFDGHQQREGLGPYAPPRLDRYRLDDVLREVGQERERQVAKGYTDQHDDAHGPAELVEYAVHRLDLVGSVDRSVGLGYPPSRETLVEVAAMLVAAVESIDRRAARGA